MSSPFLHLLRVRYSECDAQQVVFNAKYAEYVDVAATEFTRAVWGDYRQMVASGIDNQVVSLNIDWSAPAKFDDVLAISVRVGHIGTTSYSLALDFSHYASGQTIAKARITYVLVDAESHNKMKISPQLRNQLEHGAQEIVSNHAGVSIHG